MAEVWTVLKILEWTTDYFQQRGIDDGARREAELLLADTLDLDRVGLYLNFEKPLHQHELDSYRSKVKRRAAREPVQYILGSTEFWSLPFKVVPGVLIPRADTEVLVEEAVKKIESDNRVLDIGTGSGAIAISLAKEIEGLSVDALDLSEEALVIARENAELNGVTGQIKFHQGEMAAFNENGFDVIVSNPPYIPASDIEGLMQEVKDHEPRMALDGGEDGLDFYRQLATMAERALNRGGWLMVEVGIDQASDVSALFVDNGLTECTVRDDYSGIPRVVIVRLPVNDNQ